MTAAVRGLLSCLLFFFIGHTVLAQQLQIGVLALFHPHELTLSAAKGEALVVAAGEREFVLEPSTTAESARIAVSEDALVVEFHGQLIRAAEVVAAGRDRRSTRFVLGVPGKISRRYEGILRVRAIHGEVVPIISMDLETAVASVAAAELTRDTPIEALKAQAVVTRSYFLAGKGRHRNFDFCDATHCQFLREPPSPESPSTAAALATRGLVIAFEGKPVAAMFTRSCGGRTRTPAEVGVSSSSYPYYSVACDFCYKSPVRWARQISELDAARLLGKGEAGRLAVDRRLGWNTVPSNNFTIRRAEGVVILEGTGQGHGIGLCQRGARAMAEGGATFREILSHYFPNTTLVQNLETENRPR